MRSLLIPSTLVVPLLGGACGAQGALRQATLAGQCAEGDAACSRRHALAPIAVGARFHPEISADLAGTSTPTLRLESAASDILAIEDGAIRAKHPGASAVLITTDDGSVVDFVHVWVAPITRITLSRRDGDRVGGAIGLTVGEDVTLVPALWNDAQRLTGEADAVWTASDDGAVSVLRDGSADRRRIRARAPGKTTVTVAAGDVQASVEIEVVP
ncbi:MAG: hypothetical protein KIT31_13080 [Deltaproteobacteria bacterium]|nr:hypothetical protein [Deltaproteobacteria bacterium]